MDAHTRWNVHMDHVTNEFLRSAMARAPHEDDAPVEPPITEEEWVVLRLLRLIARSAAAGELVGTREFTNTCLWVYGRLGEVRFDEATDALRGEDMRATSVKYGLGG